VTPYYYIASTKNRNDGGSREWVLNVVLNYVTSLMDDSLLDPVLMCPLQNLGQSLGNFYKIE